MFNVTLEFDSIDKILDNHGLGPGGVGQNFVDNEVILFCDPKVPFATGTLKNSAKDASLIGFGTIIYEGPYARYLYYGQVYGPNIPIYSGKNLVGFRSPKGKKKRPTGRPLSYHGAPERGAFWFERAMAEHKKDIIQRLQKLIGGK